MTEESTPGAPIWPEHPPGPPDHVYAIGIVSLYYNELEESLLNLLQHFSDAPDQLTAFIFEKTSSSVRIQLLEKAMDIKGVDTAVREAINHFLKAYGICTNNRGLIIHSRIWAYRERDNAAIVSKRARKSGEQWTYEFPLPLIRRVADEILFWNRHGSFLIAYLNRLTRSRMNLPKGVQLVGPTTLPEKSPLPDDLVQNFHSKRGTPPIPQFP